MRFSIDPVTIGFDITLHEYIEAVAAGGFASAEWPVIWLPRDEPAAWERAREAFRTAAVEPAQFTSAIGVPGNLAVVRESFEIRLIDFEAWCCAGRAVGSTRASLFVDERRHGGVPLAFADLVDRVSQVVDIAGRHGIEVVIGWHDRPLLERAAAVHRAVGVTFGHIIDTVTLARSGLDAGFVDGLPPAAVGWVRVADTSASASDVSAPRLLPGRGDVDIGSIVDACRRNGYDGPLSIESNDPILAPLTKVERARAAYRAMLSAFV